MSKVAPVIQSSSNSAGLSAQAISELNQRYRSFNFEERLRRLYTDFQPERIMVTSSFAATSAYFLHIISCMRPQQVIFFIDTGFHFPETLLYRDYLVGLYHLKVEDVRADDYQHQYSEKEKLYETDPDFYQFGAEGVRHREGGVAGLPARSGGTEGGTASHWRAGIHFRQPQHELHRRMSSLTGNDGKI